MKTTVIYHNGDYDGIFCREIARKFLPDAELIGWNFGDELIPFPKTGIVYVLDLSPDVFHKEAALIDTTRLIWIDHHKTAIQKWSAQISGYRIDGVAACRLAWEWFVHPSNPTPRRAPDGTALLPSKEEFIDRKLSEPLAVRLAGEFDVWDKRDPRAETFQYGLRCRDLTAADWDDMLSIKVHSIVSNLLDDGDVAQRYAQRTDASICNSRSWLMEWEGLRFLCLNSARFNSLSFAAKDVPETGHDALLGFCFNGKVWTISLYHAKHRTDLDLSEIAKRHGGGGHRGACGFTCSELPFQLTNQ